MRPHDIEQEVRASRAKMELTFEAAVVIVERAAEDWIATYKAGDFFPHEARNLKEALHALDLVREARS